MQQKIRRRSSRFPNLKIPVLAAALALLLVLPSTLRAQNSQNGQNPPPPQADASLQSTLRLSDVHGDVRVYRGDILAFPQAFPNMPIVAGMRLVTASSGRAELQFADGSVARLAPNSSLLVSSLDATADGVSTTSLRALSGLTYYEFNTQNGQYTVSVGPETIVPSGNAVLRIDMDTTPYGVADMQGGLQLRHGTDLITTLESGQSLTFQPDDPQSYQISDSIPPNSWDQWNANRDAELAQVASSSNQSESSDNSAWNELNAYGDWYNVPGYGEGWAPSGVNSNWDPYGYGWWGYYPSWGYTWISGYPWGWWPYHCGYWNWFSGSGWMWFPGGCGWAGGFAGAWYPMAYIHTAPPHYRRVARPGGIAHKPRYKVPPVYPVNRGGRFNHVFRHFNGAKPSPHPFRLNGKELNPVRPALPAMQFAPVGGASTSRSAAAHPGGAPDRAGHAAPIVRRAPYPILNGGSNSNGSSNRARPRTGERTNFGPNPIHAPFFHPHNNGRQNTNSAPRPHPVFHPAPRPQPQHNFHPAPAPRPAPHPAFHPAPMPHPVFHPAPAFHPAPHPAGRPHR